MIRKAVSKLRGGILREIRRDTNWIYGYAAAYKMQVVFYVVLGLVSTGVGLAASVVSKYLIDAVTGHSDSVIVRIAALYIGFGLARIFISAVMKRAGAKISIRAANSIRADVFKRFLDVDWESSLDYHSGDLLSRVNSDVGTVADSILGWIPSLATGAVQFFASLDVILYYDPVMALIALVSVPITVVLSRFFLTKMRRFNARVREADAQLTSFFEEALQNLQAVKAFTLKGRFATRLEALQALYAEVSLDFNRFSVLTGGLLSVVGFAVSCLCLGWGVYRLWSGYITFGTMVLFIQLAGLLSSSFSSLVGLVPSVIAATVSAQRIRAILDLPCEEALPPLSAETVAAAAESGASVELRGISFAYRGGENVFRSLDLAAGPGEIIGIVSPSGGGKTTLIRLLLGLVTPSSGSRTVGFGGESLEIGPQTRPLFSYVAQEKFVFSGTVADTLRLTRETADDGELWEALRLACADEFVKKMPEGLSSRLGERGAGLSEGQIQRLSIARALLSPAPILLLDEATSALDIATERAVLRNMLSGGRKRTVVVTTHRPTVLSACTRVYAIRDGAAVPLSLEDIERFSEEF